MSYLQHLNVSKSTPEISGPCIFCKQEYIISFPSFESMNKSLADYFIYDKLMQDAFPSCTDEQREFMISGVCPVCWNETFDVDDEENSLAQYMDTDCLDDSERQINVVRPLEDITDYPEVDDFADMDDFEEDDFFLPTEFPPNTNE